MFATGQHPLYPHTEEDRRIVLNNLGMTEAQLTTDVESIKAWIQKQPHLEEAGIESRVAVSFLLMAKGSVERAKQRIECLYRERANIPEFNNRIKLLNNNDTPIWDSHVMMSPPKLFNGGRITYFKVFDWDKVTAEDAARNVFMLLDIRAANDFGSNDIIVLDLENITLGHVLRLNVMAFARMCWLLRHGLGIRVTSIYVINCALSSIIQAIMNIARPILSKKVMDRIKVCDNVDGLKELLTNEYLPKDYGGDFLSFADYKEKIEKTLRNEKTKQFLLDSCKLVVDESKRHKAEYNEEYLQGNFRKLELD